MANCILAWTLTCINIIPLCLHWILCVLFQKFIFPFNFEKVVKIFKVCENSFLDDYWALMCHILPHIDLVCNLLILFSLCLLWCWRIAVEALEVTLVKVVLLQMVQLIETERDKGIEVNLCNFFGRDHTDHSSWIQEDAVVMLWHILK